MVPGATTPVDTYAEWHAKLTDGQRRWVAAALEGIRGCCDDPEAVVRADMASSKYALVARVHLFGGIDQPFRKSSGGSLSGLRLVAGDYGGEGGAAALLVMDRMESKGITADDILDFYEWVRSSAQREIRSKIDEAQDFYINGFPGWAVVEMVDDKEAGRIISGGKRFNPGGYDLDPWPGEKPNVRPWHSRAFDKHRDPIGSTGSSVRQLSGESGPLPSAGPVSGPAPDEP